MVSVGNFQRILKVLVRWNAEQLWDYNNEILNLGQLRQHLLLIMH